MPKVSIIIPFYNVEDYIEECLKSVLSQTLKDIEIILIDDASTDKTKTIVNSYAKEDDRIKILTVDTRHGQGYARNRGIETAQGEYIGFVDSDDFVDEKMFETLYKKAKETDSDITMCQVSEYDDMNRTYSTSDYYSLAVLESFGDEIFSADDTKEQLLNINVALWNKIYKREYLLNTGEKFPEGFIYEDLPFFFGTYLPAKRINIVWKSLYNYRINRKNSTMQQFNNKILDRSPMVALTYEKLKKLPYFEDIKKEVQAWIINDLFHRYTLLKENFHREFFFLMKKAFQNLEIENVQDEYWKRVYHFQGYLLVMNNTFEEFNLKVFNEYLDIHKMEDRLRSELTDNCELDRRFNLVYGDLEKSFKYAEKLRDESKDQINNLSFQTDEKLSKVFDAISSINPENNNSKDDISRLIEQKISVLNTKIEEKTAQIFNILSENKIGLDGHGKNNSQEVSEEKITELNNLINTNYDEVKERISLLYNDVKDLSYVIQNNYVELGKEQYNQKEETNKNFENINNTVSNQLKEITNDYKQIINDKESEINKSINLKETEIKTEFKTATDCINDIIQNQKSHYETVISDMKAEFTKAMEKQQQVHEEEIQLLKAEIKNLEITLKEEMKSPFAKFLEKYNKNKSVSNTPEKTDKTDAEEEIQNSNINDNEELSDNNKEAE